MVSSFADFDKQAQTQAQAQDIKTLIQRGFVLRNNGEYLQAVETFSQAIAQESKNTQALLCRAQTYVQMQEHEAALKDFRELLRLDPTNAKAWHGQGVAEAELGLYPSSIDSFDRALSCEPNSDKIWYNRGRALLKLEQYEQALESFDRAVELKGDRYHTWYNRAIAQAALEYVQPAIESLDRTVAIKPSCHYAWNYRGTLLNRLFKHHEAIKSFWCSLQYEMPNPNAWYGLAASYALMDNPTAAGIHLRQAMQTNPSIYTLKVLNDTSFDTVRDHPKVRGLLQD